MNPRPNILVVEDESLIALDLSRRLPKLGFAVCAIVPTGEEAVLKAAELKPDLVLMDICLRDKMTGIEAAEIIRREHDIPVIFLSANSDEMTLAKAKLSRPSSYLVKPFKERELQIGIDLALQNHGLQRELRAARDELEERVAARTSELARANESLRREIEARRQSEAVAREQADLLAKARDAIYVRDLAGLISYWNRSAERLYLVPEREAIGRAAPALLGEGSEVSAAHAEQETLRDGEWTGELRHRARGGRELIVESRWTLVRDPAGAPRAFLVVNTDITERKQVAEQFLRAQRLDSIGALASGIAHDLNNVFAPILMAADLVADTPPAQQERIVGMIRASAHRGSDMVRQMLMFVRGSSGEMEPTELTHLLGEVRRLMEETLPPAIRVSAQIADDLGPVLGNPTQLHQVLVNLCVNARDAMPAGGELHLQLDEVPVEAEQLREQGELKPGRYVRLVVADTGSGMAPEVREKIFEPFFTTKGIGQGTGLGLSTVRAIVRDHRGFLELDSQIGRGTRFSVYFPICETLDHVAEPVTAHLPKGNGEWVIVADDEHAIREIAKLTLEAHNYRVILADDGAEAISAYLQHQADVALIITDILMPIMNGRALIHALRKLAPTLPILAFSGADEGDPLVGTLATDGVTLLRKPATPADLLMAIAEALQPAATVLMAGLHI